MTQEQLLTLTKTLIDIPGGYLLAQYERVNHDELPVYRLRFTKDGADNGLGGEHFSVTIDAENQKLMGVMYLDKTLLSDDYVTENEAKDIALNFLDKKAADLLDTIEVRWIRPTCKVPLAPPHDEGFSLNDGNVITGMRVKMWANDTRKYVWVIVASNGEVISFERDIVWDTDQHCRITEKWLHDDWLTKQNAMAEV